MVSNTMTEQKPEDAPAQDEGDINPDGMVGDPVEDDLDLDLDSFIEVDEDEEAE